MEDVKEDTGVVQLLCKTQSHGPNLIRKEAGKYLFLWAQEEGSKMRFSDHLKLPFYTSQSC